jgi:tight adherence protein C
MTLTVLLLGAGVFLGVFLLFVIALKPASAQSALLEEVAQQAQGSEGKKTAQPWRSALSLDRLAKPLGRLRGLFAGEPDPDLVRRLLLAGYRQHAHADLFLGVRLALPALLGFSVAFLVQDNAFFFFLVTIVVTFFLPDFWLAHAIKKRRERIKLSLPDGLDLLSISVEAGLGLDQAVVRVAQELRVSHLELSEELLQVNFEQRAGVPRIAAWKAMADRVNIESVRSFVAMLIQTDRFGTPVSRSLGIFSDSLRTQRRQLAEELAAKTTIKLVLPLVFLIFPEVFIVTVAPAVITVMRSMGSIVG